MKKVLIDINIIIDFLNKREDHISAAKIFDACAAKKLKGHLCAHEVTTLAYFLKKFKYSSEKKNFIINNLLDVFSIIPATEKILRLALSSNIEDYEDAVIEISAQNSEIDFIITRNLKNFEKGSVKSFTAAESLRYI